MPKVKNKEEFQFDDIQFCPVEKLKINKAYQREIEPIRLAKIKSSMRKKGFLSCRPIAVSQNYNVLDGQHRLKAAIDLGIKDVPIGIIECKEEKDEANCFVQLNGFNTRLSPKDYWAAKRKADDPMAKLLYFFNDDERSLLHGKIAIRGSNAKARFSIAQVFDMLIIVVLGINCHWKLDRDNQFTRLAEKTSCESALTKMNLFFEWFFACYGNDKHLCPMMNKNESLRSVAIFYTKLFNRGFIPTSTKTDKNKQKLEVAIKITRSFEFPPDWDRISLPTKVEMLLNHWNRKKKKHKITIVEK